MGRLTRKSKQEQEKQGIEASPLKMLPMNPRSKKPRGNARVPPPSPPTFAADQLSQGDVTSPSQSPQPDESRSQSPQVAESRSTSPPTQRTRTYNTRAASRSVSPGLLPTAANKVTKKKQQPKGRKATGPRVSAKATAPRKTASSTSRATAGATRSRREDSSTHQGAELSIVVEEPPAKQPYASLPGSFPSISHDPDEPINSTEVSHQHTPTSHRKTTRAKRARQESSPHHGADSSDDALLQRSAKRSRTNNHASAHEAPRFHEPLQTIEEQDTPQPTPAYTPASALTPFAGSSTTRTQTRPSMEANSDPDLEDTDQHQSTPRNRFGSNSRQRILAKTEAVNGEGVSSGTNAGEQRPTQTAGTPITKPLPRQNFTCPPLERGTTVAEDFGFKPMPKSMAEREREIKARFPGAARKVNPLYDLRLRRQSLNIGEDEDEDDSEHEEDLQPYTQGEFKHVKDSIRSLRWNYHKSLSEAIPGIPAPSQRVAKSKDITNHTPEQGPAPSNSAPSTSISDSRALVIPSSVSKERMILTDPKIIDMVRSAIVWATSDPTNKVPNVKQMASLLEYHKSQESVKVTSASQSAGSRSYPIEPTPVVTTYDHIIDRNGADDITAGSPDVSMSGGLGGQENIKTAGASEVQQEITEPRTPTAQPTPRAVAAPRGWLSTAKKIVQTPFTFFGRNQQAASATPTNARAETEFTFKHTSTISRQPTTPTPSNIVQPAKAQTERKPKVDLNIFGLPKKTNQVLFKDTRLPIEQRGLISEARKKEIQDAQDARAEESRLLAEDRHAADRRQKRNARTAYIDDDDEDEYHSGTIIQHSVATTGAKRKHHEFRGPPGPNTPGTYRFPSPGSSDDSSDESGDEEESDNEVINSSSTKSNINTFHLSTPTTPAPKAMREDCPLVDDATFEKRCLPLIKRAYKPIGPPNAYYNYTDFLDPLNANHRMYAGIITDENGEDAAANRHARVKVSTEKKRLRERERSLAATQDSLITDDPTRARPYTGTLFQQPPLVQANIDEGLSPLAPRSKTLLKTLPKFPSGNKNIFNRSQPLPESPSFTSKSTTAPEHENTPTKTFGTPGYESDSDSSDELNDGPTEGNAPAQSLRDPNDGTAGEDPSVQSLQQPSSVLQPKQWQQSPPPKPRPSNAQLPQPSAADIALANVNKYQPKKPSGLRNVTQMSPLQMEQERLNMGGENNMLNTEGAVAVGDADSPPLMAFEDITMADLEGSGDWDLVEGIVFKLND